MKNVKPGPRDHFSRSNILIEKLNHSALPLLAPILRHPLVIAQPQQQLDSALYIWMRRAVTQLSYCKRIFIRVKSPRPQKGIERHGGDGGNVLIKGRYLLIR